ncbi:hypothetical protein FRC02_010314 [Tulasnella sp. 418]|nr:hypothetical protein FRC02_010314 [Tulasnella sp. 418]
MLIRRDSTGSISEVSSAASNGMGHQISPSTVIVGVLLVIVISSAIILLIQHIRKRRRMQPAVVRNLNAPSGRGTLEKEKLLPVTIAMPDAVHHKQVPHRVNFHMAKRDGLGFASTGRAFPSLFLNQSRFVEHSICCQPVKGSPLKSTSPRHRPLQISTSVNRPTVRKGTPGQVIQPLPLIHLPSNGMQSVQPHSLDFNPNSLNTFITSTPRNSQSWDDATTQAQPYSIFSDVFSGTTTLESLPCPPYSASPEGLCKASRKSPDRSTSSVYSVGLDANSECDLVGPRKTQDLDDLTDLTYYCVDASLPTSNNEEHSMRYSPKFLVGFSSHGDSTISSDKLTEGTTEISYKRDLVAEMEQGAFRDRHQFSPWRNSVSRESVVNRERLFLTGEHMQMNRSWEQKLVELEHLFRVHQAYGAERRWM